MFCDLAGSTELSRHLDPEEFGDIIASYQDLFRRAIIGFDGIVARYMGDGLLAFFGFPFAHEDDAERAVYAALAIVAGSRARDVGPYALPVRIGIATGLVVVGGQIGEGLSAELVAVGEAPSLAARLEALADPNSILVAIRRAGSAAIASRWWITAHTF